MDSSLEQSESFTGCDSTANNLYITNSLNSEFMLLCAIFTIQILFFPSS